MSTGPAALHTIPHPLATLPELSSLYSGCAPIDDIRAVAGMVYDRSDNRSVVGNITSAYEKTRSSVSLCDRQHVGWSGSAQLRGRQLAPKICSGNGYGHVQAEAGNGDGDRQAEAGNEHGPVRGRFEEPSMFDALGGSDGECLMDTRVTRARGGVCAVRGVFVSGAREASRIRQSGIRVRASLKGYVLQTEGLVAGDCVHGVHGESHLSARKPGLHPRATDGRTGTRIPRPTTECAARSDPGLARSDVGTGGSDAVGAEASTGAAAAAAAAATAAAAAAAAAASGGSAKWVATAGMDMCTGGEQRSGEESPSACSESPLGSAAEMTGGGLPVSTASPHDPPARVDTPAVGGGARLGKGRRGRYGTRGDVGVPTR